MKSYITIVLGLLLLFLNPTLQAQVGINANGIDPHSSAMLDVASTNKGLLIPRMTASQRDAIAGPAHGLLVFVTDDSSFHYYDGTGWGRVGPSEPTNYVLGKRQGNPNYKMLELDQTDGSLALANGGVEITDDGTLSLSELDIQGASPGTNAIQFRGKSNTDKWLNFRTSGGSPAGRAGALFSSRDQGHFFLYGENQKLKLDLGNQNSGNPDVDNAVPIMELSSNGLELTRAPHISTGNEEAGKVLTYHPNGQASWDRPPRQADRVVSLSNSNPQGFDANNQSSWVLSSPHTNWLAFGSGNEATVRITFSASMLNGSGADPLRFRIVADGRGGCNTRYIGTTDWLDVYQTMRGRRLQTTIQQAFNVDCSGSGEYRFALETDCSQANDDVEIDDLEITAVRY